MKTKLLIASLLITATSAFAQESCAKFRTGTFKVTDPKSKQVCIITRTGDTQTEKMVESDETYDFDVKWLDDCTYTVTPTPASVAKNKDLSKAGTMTVTMTKVKDSSYVQNIKVANYPTFKRTDTVYFVKEKEE
ncbi:MAG: hypothetical protein ACO1N9_04130 [Flavobacterium sp.]